MSAPVAHVPSDPALTPSIPAPTPRGDDEPAHELAGRRVLVTGATGFLGRHLCRRLIRLGAEVHALSRHAAPHVGVLPVTVLRIAMVYGPDQPDDRKLVPYVCSCLLDGSTPSLSSGTRPVDWVYVDDVGDAFVRAATRPDAVGRILDIGSGHTSTIADLVRTLADLAGYRGPLGFGEAGDRRHDLAPASYYLGWRATTSLRAGLAQTLAWHREQHGRAAAGAAPGALTVVPRPSRTA